MKLNALVLLVLVASGTLAGAQECPGTAQYDKAREVIRDLDHIVVPGGIQESYKTRIGGIDQLSGSHSRAGRG